MSTTYIERIKLQKLYVCNHCNNDKLKGNENFCPDCGYDLDWNDLKKQGFEEIWNRR